MQKKKKSSNSLVKSNSESDDDISGISRGPVFQVSSSIQLGDGLLIPPYVPVRWTGNRSQEGKSEGAFSRLYSRGWAGKKERKSFHVLERGKQNASLGGLEPPTFRLTAERAHRLRHRDTTGHCFLFSPKASLTTKLGGGTCLSHDSSFCSKPRTTTEMESTQRVGFCGEAGRCRRQKRSRASPPRLAPLPPQTQRQEMPRA